MDIRLIYAFEVRPTDSDKVLIRIDGLNEAESDKVFKSFQMPTRSEGYDKLKLWNRGTEEDEIIRRSPLVAPNYKKLTTAPKKSEPIEPPPLKPGTAIYTPINKTRKEKGTGTPWSERGKTE